MKTCVTHTDIYESAGSRMDTGLFEIRIASSVYGQAFKPAFFAAWSDDRHIFLKGCVMNQYTSILRLPKVLAMSGCSRSYIYQLINEGLWPKSVRIGVRAVGWPESEVAAVCAARIAGKSNEEIQRLIRFLHERRNAVSSY